MHIYFSGIGGAGIGPLALIAHQAGFTVSGSDKQDSSYLSYLRQHGITNIHVGQEYDDIAAIHAKHPIDWFVYTSALPIEQPDAPELKFCADHQVKASKRDAFLSYLIEEKQLKLIAVAGTHGKTTTTAMTIWLLKQLDVPVSYSVGAKLSFGDMGEYHPDAEYFVYEADEYDRNFLAFKPYLSLITGIDWDHADIYPTRDEYDQAFKQFLQQGESAILWKSDAEHLAIKHNSRRFILDQDDNAIDQQLNLSGHVNRLDAWQVAHAVQSLTSQPLDQLLEIMNSFPGVNRRFEQLIPGVFTDYAHTPPKIRGALQLAKERAGNNVVVVYEGLHNTRQHFIKEDLQHLFEGVKQLYVVPSYLAREDPSLTLLSPTDIIGLTSPETQAHAKPANLNEALARQLQGHQAAGDLVLLLSAGGGGSLDEWARQTLASPTTGEAVSN